MIAELVQRLEARITSAAVEALTHPGPNPDAYTFGVKVGLIQGLREALAMANQLIKDEDERASIQPTFEP